MSKYFFYPVLEALSDGKIIRKLVVVTLRALSILSILGGLYLIIDLVKLSFQLPTEGTIGGLLFAVVLLGAIVAVGQVFWYRAGSVRDLGESPFTVIPIASILFRAAGEVCATVNAAVGVGGCLYIWLAKEGPYGPLKGLDSILPSVSWEPNFLGGVIFLLHLSLTAVFALLLFYFLAESSVVLVDIARHNRLMVKQEPAGAKGASSES